MAKVWWKSKTFWTNIISGIGIFVSSQFGITWTPETTTGLLVVINLILRAITKEELTLTSDEAEIKNFFSTKDE